MKKFLLLLVFAAALLSFGVSPVSAQSPRRFYDWSSTLETQNEGKVLGTQSFGQVATDSAKEATGTADTSVNSTQNSIVNETANATVSPTPVQASGFLQFNRYLIGGNISADNPFHFIKTLQENVQLTFTFDSKKKDEMRLSIAGERLDEAQKMVAGGKLSGYDGAANSYRQNMLAVAADLENLKNKNQNIDDLVKTVELETAKHNVVLENVQASVPDEAKAGLAKAIEASEVNIDKVADLTNKPAVPPDVVTRITALKAQGLLTEEEAAKLINSKTRTEARGELRKYVNEGVIPTSDFIRMNENVKAYFPQDFYQIHEVKRFYTMKKLEQDKPDDATLGRIQEFAKTYKAGEIVPPDIRKYWGPIVQLDEIQSTLRPDLIDPKLFKNNSDDYKKFNEIVERYKPRPEDVAFLQNYMAKNNSNVSTLPPEYQRMYNMGQTYGAACGSGQKWFKYTNSEGGYCASEGYSGPQDYLPTPNSGFANSNCRGNIVSVKSPGGICSAFPSDCVPSGWTKVDSCVATPGEAIGTKNTETPDRFKAKISCPSNAHFVPVPFDPAGGYCVGNYTPTGEEYARDAKAGNADAYCPTGYHRNYPGGPCLADLSYGSQYSGQGSNNPGGGYYLPPLSTNPGNYPNPYYQQGAKCGGGTHWVPEPINPSGGYCAPDNYQQNYGNPSPFSGGSGSRESQEATCKAGGGVCVSWVNGACGCERYSNPNPSCKPPDRGCEGGKWWDQAACACRENGSYPSGCTYPAGGCATGKYWDNYSCACRDNGTSPTNYGGGGMNPQSADPTGGCKNYSPGMCGGSGGWFDFSSCSCKTSSSAGSGSTGGSYTGGSSGCKPPSSGCPGGWYDYGSCSCKTSGSTSGGNYSGGSSCQPPSGGCGSNSWYDSGSCSCKSSSSTGNYSPPPSGYGSCSGGQYWNGSSCVSSGGSSGSSGGSYTPSGGDYKQQEYKKEEYKQPTEYKPPENKPPENKPQESKQPEENKPPENNPPPNNPPPQNNPPPAENPPPPNP